MIAYAATAAALACVAAHGTRTISEMLIAGTPWVSWTMHVSLLVLFVDVVVRATHWTHHALGAAMLCVLAFPMPCARLEFGSTWAWRGNGQHEAATAATLALFGAILLREGKLFALYAALVAVGLALRTRGWQTRDIWMYEAGCACELALLHVYVAWSVTRA
jgi:hypothetical protein